MVMVYLLPFICACIEWCIAGVPWYLNTYLLLINFAALVSFAIDKGRAERGEWRIPEVRLHLMTLAGGALGSGSGMFLAHHKVRKIEFHLVYWVGFVIFCTVVSYFGDGQVSKRVNAQASKAQPGLISHTVHKPRHHKVPHAASQPMNTQAEQY